MLVLFKIIDDCCVNNYNNLTKKPGKLFKNTEQLFYKKLLCISVS